MTNAPTRRKSRIRQVVAATLALAFLTTACAQIPTHSEVYSQDISVQDPSPIYYAATGPKAGATPQEIVNGFISAQVAGLSDKWVVAREYLTNSAARSWDPSSDINVYAGDLAVGPANTSDQQLIDQEPDLANINHIELRASAKSLGSVDGQGAYTESLPDAQFDAIFSLVRNIDGEWRITGLRDGLVISYPMFETNFRAVSVYFLSPTTEFLVPDVRWFSRVHAETYAVQSLITGPVAWLRDSVTSKVPDGTRLISMSVDSGIASVNLSSELLNAEPADRVLFATQLTSTLTRIPGIRSVELKADQLDVSTEIDESIVRDPTRASGDAVNPYVLHQNAVGSLQGREIVPVESVGTLAGYDVTGLAIPEEVRNGVFLSGNTQIRRLPSPAAATTQTPNDSEQTSGADQTEGAEQAEGADQTEGTEQTGGTGQSEGAERTAGADQTEGTDQTESAEPEQPDSEKPVSSGAERLPTAVLIEGELLITPSIDRYRWVWSGETRQPQEAGALKLSNSLGNSSTVLNVPWLAGRQLQSLRVSPDGTRVAVVSSANGLSHVEVAGIVRDKSGTPITVGEPVSVGGQVIDATLVHWLDESTVWVMGNAQSGTGETLFSAKISGPSSLIAPAEGIQTMTAARGTRGVVLGTDTGTIRTRGSSGASWSDVAVDAWFPTFPG